jgi:hypothetical protein
VFGIVTDNGQSNNHSYDNNFKRNKKNAGGGENSNFWYESEGRFYPD